jgi:RNA polymerase sigma-70 factor (ECF subfamily)
MNGPKTKVEKRGCAMISNLTDTELVERCRHKDSEAFSVLVDRHKRMVFSCAYRMVGDEQEAEDIAQDVFMRVYQAIPRFRGESKFSTWLYKIVSNVCLNRLRKVNPETVSIEANEEEQKFSPLRLADVGNTPEANFEWKRFRKRVRDMVAALPPQYSAVVTLRHLQGMAYDEIASALNLPLGTVKTHLFRAKERMRELLEQDGEFATAEDIPAWCEDSLAYEKS